MNSSHDQPDRQAAARNMPNPAENAPPLNPPNRRPAQSVASRSPSSGAASPVFSQSPQSSRTVSPIRQAPKPADILNVAQSGLDRMTRDASPSRAANPSAEAITTPSAVAVQKALSSIKSNLRQTSATSDTPSALSARLSSNGVKPSDVTTSMHWPVSPRLKSPPPSSRQTSLMSRSSERDLDESRIPSIQESSSQRAGQENAVLPENSKPSTNTNISIPKVLRGPSGLSSKLETVEEGDQSGSPLLTNIPALPQIVASENKIGEQQQGQELLKKEPSIAESGNESNGNKTAEAAQTATNLKKEDTRSQAPKSKRSYTSLVPTKVRTGNDGSKIMTVETETVSSIPQTAGGNASERSNGGRGDASGLLRSRPSSETMRPRKERKKATRKPASISSTAATKADIFEANVASAVDEADSEDSEETFVYESNPAEPRPRHLRHHSRTPSATSMTSLLDRKGSSRNVTGKKSMKFANVSYSAANGDKDANENSQGTVRASNHRSENHSHIGLFGRSGRTSSTQVTEDSPYSQASKVRLASELNSRQYSRPLTPKSGNAHYLRTPTRKNFSPYEYDDDGTDDESTPLVGTVRTHRPPRTRLPSRNPTSSPAHHLYYETPHRSVLSRVAGCCVMAIMVTCVILGAAGFLLATSKPLYGVSVKEIQNVLASEQEIMLDLLVQAVNPNIISVTIGDMDVNVFAKSKHVGTSENWHNPGYLKPRRSSTVRRRRRLRPNARPSWLQQRDNVDDGTDPMPDEPEEGGEAQTMLLGQIFRFDSPLSFEATPVRQSAQMSKGGLRLAQPGNKTEAGGSKRWEHVLQHPFELIVRGIFKYQLPLSSRTMTTPISASVNVVPEAGSSALKSLKVTSFRNLELGEAEEDID